MQCYYEKEVVYEKALSVIPVFNSEEEHIQFMDYVVTRGKEFKLAVELQDTDDMFPVYSQTVNTVVVYKLGKTLVQWLEDWRNY